MTIKKLYLTLSLALVALMFTSPSVWAVLPVVVAPSTAPAATNWIEVFKGYAKDGGIAIGLILAVGALIWIGYHVLADLNQVRNGRKEMGELAMSGVAGGGVLLLVMYLADQASKVM